MAINVIGCGNILRGDDGVGVYVLKELEKTVLPEGIELIEAGTACLDLLPYWENAGKVIIVDAESSGNHPGTIYRIPAGRMKPSASGRLSLHNLNLEDCLAFIRTVMGEESTSRTIILGVEVKDLETGIGLSAEVARAVPRLVDMIRQEINTG